MSHDAKSEFDQKQYIYFHFYKIHGLKILISQYTNPKFLKNLKNVSSDLL